MLKYYLILFMLFLMCISTGCGEKDYIKARKIKNITGDIRERYHTPPYVFVNFWGTKGTSDGHFANIEHIAVSPDGYIYILDGNYHYNYDNQNSYDYLRIQKFDMNGKFIKKIYSKMSINNDSDFITSITVDKNGILYIVFTNKHKVMKLDENGKFIEVCAGENCSRPYAVKTDKDGYIYVSYGVVENCIRKFDI